MQTLIQTIQFVVSVAFIIGIHELGHYLADRFFGVRVEKFYIGIPPAMMKIIHKGTEYGIGILPIGGFVKLQGMIADETFDFKQDITPEEEKGNRDYDNYTYDDEDFYSKPAWQRLIIMLSGVVMNLLFAMIGLAIVFYTTKDLSILKSIMGGFLGVLYVVYKGFGVVFGLLFGTLKIYEHIAGPVGIFNEFKETAFGYLLLKNIELSMSIAIFNLLPIPGLDGWHSLVNLFEIISGKRPSATFSKVVQIISAIMLVSIIIAVFYNDIFK